MPSLDQIIEAILFASDKPLPVDRLYALLMEKETELELKPEKDAIREALARIQIRYQGGVIQLREVASGFRFQIGAEFGPWVGLLQEEKPQRYSRALLETLAIIAYRQPITRGDIEDIRGVAVSTQIMKTLQEREWVRIVGHKDVPGKPALYATTRQFLDYFDLNSLEQLPSLVEVRDLDEIARSLEMASDESAKEGTDQERILPGVNLETGTTEGHEIETSEEQPSAKGTGETAMGEPDTDVDTDPADIASSFGNNPESDTTLH